ncbi:hypothetical protein Syun_028823 [Stephania yunnanensis]|uniref:Uncharacterized protein n=1 Tax=Stephania yunnanensis TaxID=152371 RepID=A0AAP0HGT3_9MAGN
MASKISSGLLLIFTITFATLLISTKAGAGDLGWIPAISTCDGSIGGCGGEEEFDLDSEINRRILATTQYISYGALRRNTVPCSRRGASYYNCRAGAQANPYQRGCSAITRCRR